MPKNVIICKLVAISAIILLVNMPNSLGKMKQTRLFACPHLNNPNFGKQKVFVCLFICLYIYFLCKDAFVYYKLIWF